jgi:hypothetical protein
MTTICYNNFNGKYWTVIGPELSKRRDLDYQGTTVLPYFLLCTSLVKVLG